MLAEKTSSPKTTSRWQPRTLYYWLARLGSNTTSVITILVLLNIACYYSTIDGYFLADDFSHVSYLYTVFNGHPELLLENFWTTWMKTEGTQFYRPVISLTLAFDYLLWSGNARGFHLSNLVYQILSSIGVFLVAKRLFLTDLKGKAKEKNQDDDSIETKSYINYRLSPDHVYTINFTSLLAASIFAVHPLHPEVVSWIIGRVDSVCTMFYLFSLWLFLVSLQSQNAKVYKRARIASLALFVCALGSKEMAVTLPPTLLLLLLFFQTPVYGRARSIPIRILNAIKASWRYWLILVLYLVIRTMSLGTFMGGYQGSIGEGLTSSLLERLLSQRQVLRVLFPLNMEIFSPDSKWFTYLRIIYGTALFSFVFTLLISRSKDTVIKSVMFTGLWFILIMIPTIPVWNLTDTLQSSRFIYMGTVPLSILIALFVCPLARHGRIRYKNREKTNFSLRITQDFLKGLSATIAILLVLSFTLITEKNNSSWARAGEEVKQLRYQLAQKVEKLTGSEKIALLNTPDRYKGAHMLYNGAQIQVLLEPPLTPFSGQDKVLTFEPAMYGDSDLVRASRLKELSNLDPTLKVYKWDRANLELVVLNLKLEDMEEKNIEFKTDSMPVPSNTILISPILDTASLSTDFVELDIALKDNKGSNQEDRELPVILYWNSDKNPAFSPYKFLNGSIKTGSKPKKLIINTSEHKKWIEDERISRLAVSSPGNEGLLSLNGIKCYSGSTSIPLLHLREKNIKVDERGIINLGKEMNNLAITYDASKISGAQKIIIEISKPNSWFEHYTGTFRDAEISEKAMLTKSLQSTKEDNYSLDLSSLKDSGFYQVRVAGASSTGKVVGYFSDPLVLQVTR